MKSCRGSGLFEHNAIFNCMKVAVAVVGGAAVAGAVTKGISSSKAASQQAAAAQQAYQGEENQMQQNSTNQQPYMTAGSNAIGQIGSDLTNGTGFAAPFTMANFMSDPGYQFQLQQGQNAVQGSAAAAGGALSGGTLKALDQYTTGLANTTYGDAYNRYLQASNQQYNQLYGVAGLGEQATGTLGAQNTAAQQAAGNFLTQKGSAQAAGTLGVGNAINSGIQGVGGAILGSQSGYGGSVPTNTNGGTSSSGYAGGNYGISGPISGVGLNPPTYGQPISSPINGTGSPYQPIGIANPIYSAGY